MYICICIYKYVYIYIQDIYIHTEWVLYKSTSAIDYVKREPRHRMALHVVILCRPKHLLIRSARLHLTTFGVQLDGDFSDVHSI